MFGRESRLYRLRKFHTFRGSAGAVIVNPFSEFMACVRGYVSMDQSCRALRLEYTIDLLGNAKTATPESINDAYQTRTILNDKRSCAA